MNRTIRTTTLALTLLAALGVTSPAAAAQPEAPSLAAGLRRARNLLVGLKHGTIERSSLPTSRPAPVPEGETAALGVFDPGNLVGTWFVEVPGDAPFQAYQTFGQDGTFVETSSLLGSLVEGPAHGAWRIIGNSTFLTFELFAFDAGQAVGRIRVRCRVRVNGDSFAADSAVDILDLAGNEVAPEVATGPFYGSRVTPLPL